MCAQVKWLKKKEGKTAAGIYKVVKYHTFLWLRTDDQSVGQRWRRHVYRFYNLSV